MVDSISTQKYLLYAIEEIALVVIGILIAPQINNWNDDSTKIKTIKIYLQNLVDDVRADIVKLSERKKGKTFLYYSAQYLLQLANEPRYDPIPDGTL